MIQLAANTDHINNGFGVHNLGVMMGMPGVKYSGSYGNSFFGTSNTRAAPVDNDRDVVISVAHTALFYSA